MITKSYKETFGVKADGRAVWFVRSLDYALLGIYVNLHGASTQQRLSTLEGGKLTLVAWFIQNTPSLCNR